MNAYAFARNATRPHKATGVKFHAPCGLRTLETNPHVRGFVVHPEAGQDEPVLEWCQKDYTLEAEEFESALLRAELLLVLRGKPVEPVDDVQIVRIFKDWIGTPPAMEFLFGEAGRVYMTCVRKLSPCTPVLRKDLGAWLAFARRFEGWDGLSSTPFKDEQPFWDVEDTEFLRQEELERVLAEAADRCEVLVQRRERRSNSGMCRYWVVDLKGKEFANCLGDFFEVLAVVAKHNLEGNWCAYAGEQFNRYRGAPWEVTGDGRGKATGVISFYPNANPSHGEGPFSYAVEDRDGEVVLTEGPAEEVKFQLGGLAEAGITLE